MEIDFNNLDDIEIDKEGITKKKYNKIIIIVPFFSIIITLSVLVSSFYFLIKYGNKHKKEIIINCIEGPDDACFKCKNDKCIKCNYRYDLINGTCEPTFSIKVIYETTQYNESIEIFNNYKYKVYGLELDNETKEIEDERDFNYIIENPGNHTAYALFDTSGLNKIITSIFGSEEKIIYIHFTKKFDSKNITTFHGLFFDYKKLKYVDISNFDISEAYHMDNIFFGCSSLEAVKLPNSIAPNLMSMSYMFSNCENLTSVHFSKELNYSTKQLRKLDGMFLDCFSLTSVDFSFLESDNINSTKNMFRNCYSLSSIDLSNFKSHYTEMDYMFGNCSSLNFLDISNFDVPSSCINCFSNVSKNGKIRVNKNIEEYMKKILPKNWIFEIK